MNHNQYRKIATISDFSGFGRCSITAALPIISALKIQNCPLPTSIFSNHTGFDSFFKTDFTPHMQAYMDEWAKLDLRFDGILTGFLSSPEQVDLTLNFFERFGGSHVITVVDPVMGDYGKLYPTYSPQLANKLSQLLPKADILTPNLTEACILTKSEYRSNPNDEFLFTLCQKLGKNGPKKIVITGLERNDTLENYVYEDGSTPTVITSPKIGPYRSGTGDVFSAIVAGDAVNGKSFTDSISHAASFITKVMQETVKREMPLTDGICFEEFLCEL